MGTDRIVRSRYGVALGLLLATSGSIAVSSGCSPDGRTFGASQPVADAGATPNSTADLPDMTGATPGMTSIAPGMTGAAPGTTNTAPGTTNTAPGSTDWPSSADGQTNQPSTGSESPDPRTSTEPHSESTGGTEIGATGTSEEGWASGTGEESGAQCELGDGANTCPENTECRRYEVSGCDQAGKPVCESTNVDAGTPCENSAGQCDGKGQCVVPNLALLGETCEADAQCGSGHCAAGANGAKLCCDAACDGVCTACSSDGHCNVTPTEDAECGVVTCPGSNACTTYPPSRALCASFGVCETTASYCEPQYTTASCSGGGTCDGRGNCCPKPSRERQCTKECPCGTGEGVCSNDNQCLTGYVCSTDAKAKLGFPAASCLPAHCVNNVKDAGETSVDCGGGCGCRATYEVVQMTGVPQGNQATVVKMSGDGSTFAAILDRGRPIYPARVKANGAFTELQAFGSTGWPHAISTDGSVIVGSAGCAQAGCSSGYERPVRWVNNAAPQVLADSSGAAKAVSGSGTMVAYQVAEGLYRVNMDTNGTSAITGMDFIEDMSADGSYIVGNQYSNGVLWQVPGGVVSLSPPADWSSWAINVMSADGKVFAGTASKQGALNTISFIWKNGQFSQLPVLPGATGNAIGGISADGKVVVGYTTIGSFIWDAVSNEIRTVVSEARTRGLELPNDLVLDDEPLVSDDGRTIVGQFPFASQPNTYWRVKLLPDGELLP